jgi:thiol-disulfide isomerase/thioredoxin
MKNTIICFLLATFSSIAQTRVAKLSGKIDNRNSDKITLTGANNFKQVIPVKKDGSFSTSFDAPEAIYEFYDGAEFTEMYLKNGFDMTMTIDAKMFDETLKYSGKGANENNILAQKTLTEEALEEKIMAVKDDNEALGKLIMGYTSDLKAKMTAPGIDPGLKKAYDEKNRVAAEKQKEQKAEMEAAREATKKLNGSVSPDFAYENYKGGTTKLSDLKGKYVYIDTWATWCGPCRQEIPHLQKVEEKYKGKNIEFVSISVDVQKDNEKWKKFVADKALGGIQLFADKDWSSDFIKAYNINSIPRFILIDTKGVIVSADAERPSSPELTKMLDELLK